MTKPLIIDYYTDILCVWAWIAQRRIDELNLVLKDKIEFRYHYMDNFGNVPLKMQTQWKPKGGLPGFIEHVYDSASAYEEAPINPKIWTEVRPITSANAHLVLKAIEIAYSRDKSIEMALVFRQAFFVDAIDISNLHILYELAETNGLDPDKIISAVNNGSAIATLMNDYQQSKRLSLQGSPTYIINDGRQTLYGNIGYRVLLANIEELLKKPSNEANWC